MGWHARHKSLELDWRSLVWLGPGACSDFAKLCWTSKNETMQSLSALWPTNFCDSCVTSPSASWALKVLLQVQVQWGLDEATMEALPNGMPPRTFAGLSFYVQRHPCLYCAIFFWEFRLSFLPPSFFSIHQLLNDKISVLSFEPRKLFASFFFSKRGFLFE